MCVLALVHSLEVTIEALKQGNILPPHVAHERIKRMYSWDNVAMRTEKVSNFFATEQCKTPKAFGFLVCGWNKGFKVWFSHSYNCTLVSGAVCPPSQNFSLLATAHDCERSSEAMTTWQYWFFCTFIGLQCYCQTTRCFT